MQFGPESDTPGSNLVAFVGYQWCQVKAVLSIRQKLAKTMSNKTHLGLGLYFLAPTTKKSNDFFFFKCTQLLFR